MGSPAIGGVVLVPFPFSDLSSAKLRPAVVLASVRRGDYVLCQVTSNPHADPLAVEIKGDDFSSGSLERTSFVRVGKLFTANENLVVRQVGALKADVHHRIILTLVRMLLDACSRP